MIAIDMEYEEGDAGDFKPVVRTVDVKQLKAWADNTGSGCWHTTTLRSPG
ncbi:hypothetical protein PO124_07910 [Bacillus licheniformis]|nr:hypothetical protein [Bacillus licheniformis]